MSYTAEISRVNPACFLFLIDQSLSMADPFGGSGAHKRKSEEVADAINRLLQELVIKCAKSEGVRDYYHVGVIGYGGRVDSALHGALSGAANGRDLVSISHVADHPLRVEERIRRMDDGAGGLVEQTVKFPVWFDPVANGSTPMCQALERAHRGVSAWLADHPDSFPPIVINITDGESTDGDPEAGMAALKALRSSDGDVLLFNIHLSSRPNAVPLIFPDSARDLPDHHAVTLFNGASPLPEFMHPLAREYGMPVTAQSRAFVMNADLVALIQALDIGTRPANLR